MSNSKHHTLMMNYHQKISDNLEQKIFKVRHLIKKDNRMSELERKLRLKKLESDDQVDYHQEQFIKSFARGTGIDYTTIPSDEEIFNYVYIIKSTHGRIFSTIKNDSSLDIS